jgi:hypothetical protein
MKLLAAISHHGLGHLAQAAPVLNALRRLQPTLDRLDAFDTFELTLWSGLSHAALHERIEGDFTHRHAAADVGMIMHDAMRVNLAASHAAYCDFHLDWSERVQTEAAWMRAQAFDQVLADVAYLPLAAAAQAAIPATALCSLNWFDISQAYLQHLDGMPQILREIRAAYASAAHFLQPTPAMPMTGLTGISPLCCTSINPIAARGRNQHTALLAKMALPANSTLALIGFGGIGYQGKAELPQVKNLLWLVPGDWVQSTNADPSLPQHARQDVLTFQQTGMSFLDLVASSDVMITKVGYGSFVEATAHQIPILFLDRPDWPETPFLTEWLFKNNIAAAIDEATLFSARIETELHALWRQAKKKPIKTDGAEQAALHLMSQVSQVPQVPQPAHPAHP